jgi:molecular chaperone GrpE
MTLEQLKQVFTNHNITRINPEGEQFDYNFHQAMFEKETTDVDPGTIVEVMQPGWILHDRLLRPAMVGVSKKKSEKS